MVVPMRSTLSVLAAIAPLCLAQSATTTCNPLSTPSCPADTALNTESFSSTWTSSNSLDGWKTTAGTVNFDSNGAEFVIHKEGDAPTIQTDFYIFHGYFEVKMKAASGTGIVSSIVMLSDVNDEIDWEFTGGDTTQTQTNYFGKGYTGTYDRAVWFPVASPQTQVHTYAVNWTADAITWIIDGTAVRTLTPSEADGGVHFPQTPMRCRLGIWAGGDPSNGQGTIEWAGGLTDFSQAPFTMTVQSIKIENYSPGSSYSYSDTSGSAGSIKVAGGSANSNGGVFADSSSSSSTPAPSSSTSATKAAPTSPATTSKPAPVAPTSTNTAKGSTATKALSTIPLQNGATSGSSSSGVKSSGSSNSASSTSDSSSSASNSAASSSSTGGGSSLGTHAAGSENALAALVLFVLAALCAF